MQSDLIQTSDERALPSRRRARSLTLAALVLRIFEGVVTVGLGILLDSVCLGSFGLASWLSAWRAGGRYRALGRAPSCGLHAGSQGAGRRISKALWGLAAGTAFAASMQNREGFASSSMGALLLFGWMNVVGMRLLYWAKESWAKLEDIEESPRKQPGYWRGYALMFGSTIFGLLLKLPSPDPATALVLAGVLAAEGVQSWRAAGEAEREAACRCER